MHAASLLLVEEHTEVRSALRAWLLASFPPLKLSEARGMEEALRAAGQAGLDFALVNMELPGPNGIEVARALRRLCPQCRIVVMSLNDSEALRIAAIEAGATAFVSKRELRISLPPLFSRLI